MNVEKWMMDCLLRGECSRVMMRGAHTPAFEAEIDVIEARWREDPPACPICGLAQLDLWMGDGDASTDTFACPSCGATSAEFGVVVGEAA